MRRRSLVGRARMYGGCISHTVTSQAAARMLTACFLVTPFMLTRPDCHQVSSSRCHRSEYHQGSIWSIMPFVKCDIGASAFCLLVVRIPLIPLTTRKPRPHSRVHNSRLPVQQHHHHPCRVVNSFSPDDGLRTTHTSVHTRPRTCRVYVTGQ